MTFPKENLIRMSTNVRASSDDDGRRVLYGVPIVFNEWTEINGWEGKFLERIAPEAVTKTLAERGDKVKVLFNHGFDPEIGEKPLGKPSRQEPKDYGLEVEVPLSDTSYNRDVMIPLLDDGVLDGMSFRFGVVGEEWEDLDSELPKRTITELRLYEYGPVTFPAYEATTVGVRSRDEYDTFASRREYLDQILDPKSPTVPAGVEADEPPTQSRDLSSEKIAALRRIDMYLKGVSA